VFGQWIEVVSYNNSQLVGYVKLGMKTTKEARVGDTFYHAQKDNSVPVELFSGFKPAKAMVFAGIYPEENGEFDALRDAIEKLTLNDPSVTADRDHKYVFDSKKYCFLITFYSDVLGMGYRCGFLGLLHMDVFLQRLREVRLSKVGFNSVNYESRSIILPSLLLLQIFQFDSKCWMVQLLK